ncbi:MAG: hypothetical protein KBB39_17935 [Phycicoccus sp.]|jgi:hypothetical protein|nr:hypothetical protein [Phycicoccus sp.]
MRNDWLTVGGLAVIWGLTWIIPQLRFLQPLAGFLTVGILALALVRAWQMRGRRRTVR